MSDRRQPLDEGVSRDAVFRLARRDLTEVRERYKDLVDFDAVIVEFLRDPGIPTGDRPARRGTADPALLSVAQAAAIFERSERAMREWMADDDFPLRVLRRGRQMALSARQVERYLNAEEPQP